MRAETDTRSLASTNLPSGFSFVMNADHGKLWTPDGEIVFFPEGFSVSVVEAVAFERAGEVVRSSEPDVYELINEVLGATNWTTEKREDWLTEYFYASAEEQREEMDLLRNYFGGSDPGSDPNDDEAKVGWRR